MKGWKPEFKNSVFWERPIRSWGHISCFRYLFFREHLPSLIQINVGMVGFFFFFLLQTLFKYLCCTRVWYADHFSKLSGNLCSFPGQTSRGMLSFAHLLPRLSRKAGVCKRISQPCMKSFTFIKQVVFLCMGFFLKLFLSSLWEKCVAFFTSGDCGSAL